MNLEIGSSEHSEIEDTETVIGEGDLVASTLDRNMKGRIQEFFSDTDEKGNIVKVAKVKTADGLEYTARPDQLIKIE